MKKRIESKDSQANEGTNIDPLKYNADTAANKTSLFSELGDKKVQLKRGSKEERDQRKDLSNEFFLADFELEQ
jgi:hypothetical protein